MITKAVILAGGLGSRLKPFSEVIPKPLLPLGEKAITEVQITQLCEHGFEEVFLATNYRSDYIAAFLGDGSKYGISLHYSQEDQPLGTCGPLTLIKDRLDTPFLVMNGDILTKASYTKICRFAEAEGSLLTVATKIISTPFRFGKITVDDSNKVTRVEEKPDFHVEILAGIYCMQPGIFELIPEGKFFGMDTLIQSMIDKGLPISRYLIEEYWLDIGQVEDYSKAREAYHEHFEAV